MIERFINNWLMDGLGWEEKFSMFLEEKNEYNEGKSGGMYRFSINEG